ncbi:hypothetical protein HPB50_000765 [Hyalomma asiaticum]|uniref:Uncharacterized protein n=1 Tax=Hyalomma asiaticum TaxID=266040 RepID=A0ACB7SRM2_HYAAI|nr:hypothetical protein HPB50_000765 [Hyalomma asiaticum]
MGPASCLVLVLVCTVLFSTPVHAHDISGDADAPKAKERLGIIATINYALRMSAVLGLLWILLLRLVPPLAVLSPWFFNGMGLTLARSSTDAMLDTVLHWVRFRHLAQLCSAAEPLQCLRSLG